MIPMLMVACQNNDNKTEETAIEFNLTDIPEELKINSSVGFNKNTKVSIGEVGHCRLTFESLPNGVKQFDFIAGDVNEVIRVADLKIF